jgi:triacylglycerol lipase
MKKYLERKGFRVYWTNFSLTKGGAEKGASYLDSYIKKHKINNAVLVGISMGAFSAFVYLQRYNGWERVNKFISVAGPFRGSPLAFIPSFFAKTHQIRPNSNYIKKLMSEPIRNPEKIVCIGAQKDEMVPLSSVFLRRARNKLVKVKGHNFLHMFSLAVFRTIAAEAEKEY